jgi:hypothetical protein
MYKYGEKLRIIHNSCGGAWPVGTIVYFLNQNKQMNAVTVCADMMKQSYLQAYRPSDVISYRKYINEEEVRMNVTGA